MKTLITIALLALAAMAPATYATAATAAATKSEPLLLAQAQQQPKKQPKVAGQAKNSVQNEQKMPGCDRDRILVPDGETWCRKNNLYQCNATTGNWIGTGKNCAGR